MRNINEYKKRFYNLMESTLGDVKPLISESPQHEEFVTPTMDMLSNGEAHSSSDGAGGYGKTINSKTSLSGNEYKFTLAEGMYESLESISIGFWIDGKLKLQEKVLSTDITKSDNVTYTNVPKISAYGKRYINFKFNMPKTQNEFKEKSPFIVYIDVPCKNVRGGKLRFSAEVPSSSEIFESPEITERDLSRIVKRVINEQPQETLRPLPDNFKVHPGTTSVSFLELGGVLEKASNEINFTDSLGKVWAVTKEWVWQQKGVDDDPRFVSPSGRGDVDYEFKKLFDGRRPM